MPHHRTAADFKVLDDVDFVTGQEPQAWDDDFITDVRISFVLEGKALARLFKWQQRVLGRRLQKVTGPSAVRELQYNTRYADSLLTSLRKPAFNLVREYAQDELDQWPIHMRIEWGDNPRYWEATVDKRRESITFTVELTVEGEWDQSDLREATIKLAYQRPDLRPHLLKILRNTR